MNLPGYDATRVTSLTAVDISRGMLEKAEARADAGPVRGRAAGKRGDLAVADAERLPLRTRRSTAWWTRFRCAFSPTPRRRSGRCDVLKPDGMALLVEHTKSKTVPLLGAYQDLAAPVTKMSKGARGTKTWSRWRRARACA